MIAIAIRNYLVPQRSLCRSLSLVLLWAGLAGTMPAQNASPGVVTAAAGESHQTPDAPVVITLQDALQRARQNNPEFRAAQTDAQLARQDRLQSRAVLLPSVNYNASFLYTEGRGANNNPRFIANNGVHEYISQGNAHQELSFGNVADYRRTAALEAVAKARSEIASRGLVVTVVQTYYAFIVAQRKYATVQRAFSEAERFFGISQKLERGGEVAHSDTIKAQIQFQQQQRELREAQLEMNRSRLELAVLVFPDFNENFTVVDDLQTPESLPAFSEIQTAAARNNPELRAALSTLEAANHAVGVSWNGFLPSLSLDYFYGIDANQFAVRSNGVRNLGYAATATLQVPVWNWGSNRSKLKQATLRRDQARVELSFAQRQLLAHLRDFYDEAQTARSQLESLQQSAELAAESLRLTTLRYQAGESTVLEVVDAQNTSTLARNAFDDGQARFRVSIANLQTLTGSF